MKREPLCDFPVIAEFKPDRWVKHHPEHGRVESLLPRNGRADNLLELWVIVEPAIMYHFQARLNYYQALWYAIHALQLSLESLPRSAQTAPVIPLRLPLHAHNVLHARDAVVPRL